MSLRGGMFVNYSDYNVGDQYNPPYWPPHVVRQPVLQLHDTIHSTCASTTSRSEVNGTKIQHLTANPIQLATDNCSPFQWCSQSGATGVISPLKLLVNVFFSN